MKVTKIGFLNDDNVVVGTVEREVFGLLNGNFPEKIISGPIIQPSPPGSRRERLPIYETAPNEKLKFSTTITIHFTWDKGMYSKPLPTEVYVYKFTLTKQLIQPVSLLSETEFYEMEGGFFVGIFLFKRFLFRVEIEQGTLEFKEKAMLLIKKQVYGEEKRWKKIKEEVELMEKVINYDSTIKRTAIPDAVKLYVFTRDGGKCVRCKSNKTLHFDHIIPVSKGGGNSEENIQILCSTCNLKKSNNITF